MITGLEGKLLLTPKETAYALGISERELYRIMRGESWPLVYIGRHPKIPVKFLESWIENKKQVA
jgi:hypothetical protein